MKFETDVITINTNIANTHKILELRKILRAPGLNSGNAFKYGINPAGTRYSIDVDDAYIELLSDERRHSLMLWKLKYS